MLQPLALGKGEGDDAMTTIVIRIAAACDSACLQRLCDVVRPRYHFTICRKPTRATSIVN